MKQLVKKCFRKYCPNITALRKKLNDAKLRDINKYTMQSEDVLVGEISAEKQATIVQHYSKKWPSYTKMLNQKLDEYISHCRTVKTRNDLEVLREKVLFACFAYGFLPDEFFAFELEYKSPEERKKYISNRDRDNYVYKMNDIIDIDIFLDKYKTYVKFRKYFKRDAFSVERQTDYQGFCKFVKKHPVFVQKNVGLSKGDSVELINSKNCGKSIKQLFDEMLTNGRYIVEEKVEQSIYMSRLNESSVNTIRCMSFKTKNGIEIGPCFLKVGQGNSFVDNGGKGGILIGVDNKTGILNTAGYDEFLKEYPEHPDTKIKFIGYQLPEWGTMRKLVIELSNQIPSVRYIGWDLAHTNAGWIVIEGNGGGQFIGPQIVWKRGFKKDIEKYVKAVGEEND